MLENNSWLCSEIINTCMKIIAKQFPHTPISGFQPTGLVPYFDEHTQCWTEHFGRFQLQSTVGTNTPHRRAISPHFHNLHHQTLRLSKYIQGKLNLFVIVVNLMCSRIWLDVRQNEVELNTVNGYTRVVQEFQGIGFVMNIVTVDSATCIDISVVSFLNE